MYYQPMNVMEDGIVIDTRSVGPSFVSNMKPPITVNPLAKVTWLRDEQPWNALPPKHNNIGLINYEFMKIYVITKF